MYVKSVVVDCGPGLAGMQATYFIQKANEFKSTVWLGADTRRINAKSLLGVLSMGVASGTEVTLSAEGSDEKAAVEALTELLTREII